MQHVTGIHHITAIASAPQPNVDLYEKVLGQRTTKVTVNFDDPSSYHLYYSDYTASPGTLLTFFTWPHLRTGQHGAGEVAATRYGVDPEHFLFWKARLKEYGVDVEEKVSAFGEKLLSFSDPDGLQLQVAEHTGIPVQPWAMFGVEKAQVLQGFFSAELHVSNLEDMDLLLTHGLGLVKQAQASQAARYTFAGSDVPVIDLVIDNTQAQMGTGSVHHIAFRVPDKATQLKMREQLLGVGISSTQVIDRQYFTSVYFQTPAGILFEIATDGPGFAVDEAIEHLGESLQLPAQYRSQRAQIGRSLPPITLPRNGS